MSRKQLKAQRASRSGTARSRAGHAFVTFLMRNDSYLPGALVLGYVLSRQDTGADRVCMVTPEITREAREALSLVFEQVVDVDSIYVPHVRRQERQDRPYMFTRLNALRLGADGDLGFAYDKIVLLDADVLPLRCYEGLFDVRAPAGILNERKSHFVEVDGTGSYVVPESVWTQNKWKWHEIYDPVCPHGARIPREITDRVREDPTNLGINGSLFVLEPSMDEFRAIEADIRRPEVEALVGDRFDWPEMQYLTLRWSGQWTNVDVRYSALNGYPDLSVLYGTHFGGFKPWRVTKKSIDCYARYPDYQRWFGEYIELVTRAYPQLLELRRLRRLLEGIKALDVAAGA
jgi:alpha-N-acetylglucosamine transferase